MTTTAETLSRIATRPTWAEVSLSALRQNFRTVQKHVGAGVTVCAVVKADAYGHGAVECSRALEAEGATWLGVTSLDEAIPLREAGIAYEALDNGFRSCPDPKKLQRICDRLGSGAGRSFFWRSPPPVAVHSHG